MSEKLCRKCSTVKSLHEFRPRGTRHRTYCKSCEREDNRLRRRKAYLADPEHVLSVNKAWRDRQPSSWYRDRSLKERYGISLSELDAKLEAQDFRCASCEDVLIPGQSTHVDHCHKTGSVRGILCQACNKALGFLQDDPHRVERLLDYIREYTND